MRICITNDDSIHGEGLLILANWAKKLGEVTIVAPKEQQSGKSHSIEFHHGFTVEKVSHPSGVEAYTVDSTPADCVRIALLALKKPFDLLLSGINCGYNLGREIIYSGTVGAALEATVHGVKSIALSTGFDTFAAAEQYLDNLWLFFQEHRLLEKGDAWNVNFPEETDGRILITRQGGPFYSDDFVWKDNKVYASGKCVWPESDDMRYDTNAVLSGKHISVTPICNDHTDERAFSLLMQNK